MKSGPVSFRLSASDYEKLATLAETKNVTPGILAGELVQKALHATSAVDLGRPVTKCELVPLLGHLAYCLIVALSAEMNEDQTNEFLKEEFFSAMPQQK